MQNVWFDTFTKVHPRFKTAVVPFQKEAYVLHRRKYTFTVLVHFGRSNWCFDREKSLPYFNGNGIAEP